MDKFIIKVGKYYITGDNIKAGYPTQASDDLKRAKIFTQSEVDRFKECTCAPLNIIKV